jgi:hypothetical protein
MQRKGVGIQGELGSTGVEISKLGGVKEAAKLWSI